MRHDSWSHPWGEVKYTPGSTNIAMKKGPFEDVFPVENVGIPASYVSLPESNSYI